MRIILRRLCVLPICLYKCFISPILPPACRFYPSCSTYAIEAIMIHGIIKGAWLALCRLSRCHPFGGSGLDPVPSKKNPAAHSPAKEQISHAGK